MLKWAYDLSTIAFTQAVLNFIVVPFIVLEVGPSIQVFASVNYYGLFLIFVPFFLLQVGGAQVLKSALKRRNEGASKGDRESRVEREGRREFERDLEVKRKARGEGIPALGVEMAEATGEESGAELEGKKDL